MARVRMNKMTEHAYSFAIKAAIDTCNKDNSCDLVKSLKGITVDWSSAQLRGIKQVFGEERADELLCGCNIRQHCVAADPQPLCTFIYDIGTLHESSSSCG